jgi:Domain of unknown function (DUF4105)
VRLRIFSAAICLIAILFSAPKIAHASEPIDSVLELAELEHLSDRIEWRKLGHYRSTLFANAQSEVDGKEFFIAPNGKKSPRAELRATLEAFFLPVIFGHEDDHAICRFPARFDWLDEELALSHLLKKPTCPKLEKYLSDADADQLVYVYTSNYLMNPASMFGHTFIRVTRKEKSVSRDRDLTIEFTAITDTKNPFFYAFKGLTGLFNGKFELQSFANKLVEYSDIEQRDLWEYELALRPSEVHRFMLHVWELAATHIDYTYLHGNCSYHLLASIEAAAPRLDLIDRLKTTVFPVDTVTAVFDQPGLVDKIETFPSQRNRDKSAAYHLPVPADKAPELGHGPMRFDLGTGAGTQFHESFATIGFRLAMHDPADPATGEPDLTALQFMDTRARFSETHRSLTIDEITFAELFALNPFGKFEKLISFRVRAYGERIHDNGCNTHDCFAHGADFAAGLTLATHDERFAIFAMADATVLFAPDFDGIGGSFVRAGVGPYGGFRARVGRSLTLFVTGNAYYLPAQHLASTFDARANLRAGLTKNIALGINGRASPLSLEGTFESYIYF